MSFGFLKGSPISLICTLVPVLYREYERSIISNFSTIRCLNSRQMVEDSDLCLQLNFHLFVQFEIGHGHETKPYFRIPAWVAGQFAITWKYPTIYIRKYLQIDKWEILCIILIFPAKVHSSSARISSMGLLKTSDRLSMAPWKKTDIVINRSPSLGACNSHNKPMQQHFYRPVYF